MKRAWTSKPARMWIDGNCFEIKRFDKRNKKVADDSPIKDNTINEKYEINTNEEGKLFTSFRLPPAYYGKLLYFPHLDLKTLEHSTNTAISIPRKGDLAGKVVITGDNEKKITEARDELHSVIGEIRNQHVAMQFISIPIKSEEIHENFIKFRDEILNGDKINGMDPSIFISPLKLHLTVVVFALLDDTEKTEAIKALKDYKNAVLDPLTKKTGPIKLKLEGIDCMQENLQKVNVLYAKASIVDENEEFNLQKMINEISDHFYERGLVTRYQENVKLHMTLINTKYRKTTNSPKKRWTKKETFDATPIMTKYKDFHFGTCQLNSLHLSLMSTVGDDGFYKPLSIITVQA